MRGRRVDVRLLRKQQAVEQSAGDLGLKGEEGQLCGVTGRKERKPAP